MTGSKKKNLNVASKQFASLVLGKYLIFVGNFLKMSLFIMQVFE